MLLEAVCAFILSLGMVYLVKNNAVKLGMIDIPNARSTHREETARGAGIGFFLASMLTLSFFNYTMLLHFPWTYTAIWLIFVVGVLDDHYDTSPNTKFIVIILATVLLYFDGIVIDDLGTYWGKKLSLGWMALPFTIFAVAGFTNALNLADGLDGLAGTISIVILSGFWVVGYMHNDTFIMLFSTIFIASLLAFLVFNWYPASIFMGDSGSLTLGFVISVLAIKSLAYLPTVSILFIAALPILDTLVVMIRRKRSGRSVFSADHCHLHHVLRRFFMEDTRKTVIFLGVFQAVYTFTGLQLDKKMDEGYLLILFGLNIVLFYLFVSTMIKRQKQEC
ncbi:glycosyltransferase family 4 protein [Sulfurovum sp.]|uniref:glycosyltransferase family 4 protein n=1 Tax=Sulfurovum sp. TaxID=1969726 RepID=UPI0025D36160|nr:MraY family glycosyltransferase [Sulfurovum sp.]